MGMGLGMKLIGTQVACVFSFFILSIPSSHACRVPPREQVLTPDEQIEMAVDVSVAKVIRSSTSFPSYGSERHAVTYEFVVQEHIVGADEPRFIIIGTDEETRDKPRSSDHSDREFWERGGGRLYNGADCVLRPNFKVGEFYLVFRGSPAAWRSFEHIEAVDGKPNPDDKWLSYVKGKLAFRKPWKRWLNPTIGNAGNLPPR